MLTSEDIKNLTEYQKEIFATKNDIQELQRKIEQRMDTLTNAVDGFAKEALKNSQEITVLTNRVGRAEHHLQQIADKVNIKLEY